MSAPGKRPLPEFSDRPSYPSYICTLCGRKPFESYKQHSESEYHKRKVAQLSVDQLEMNEPNPSLASGSGSDAVNAMNWTSGDGGDEDDPPDFGIGPHSDETNLWNQDDSAIFETPANAPIHVEEVVQERPDLIWNAIYNLGLGEDDEENDDAAPHEPGMEEQEDEIVYNDDEGSEKDDSGSHEWYPFKKKEYLVAILIIGSTRSLLSRGLYEKIRDILTICAVCLPTWKTLQSLRKSLKESMGLTVTNTRSVLGTPCFTLPIKEGIMLNLANPTIRPHLITIPELSTNAPINRLSQSKKWREGIKKELRTPMIETRHGHFYIYKPVQLLSSNGDNLLSKCLTTNIYPNTVTQGLDICIYAEPEFSSEDLTTINVNDFWRSISMVYLPDGRKLTDLCGSSMYQSTSDALFPIPIQNPWRSKANGRLIRHIPITLYSDDTSGNQSKKYNSHMSFYYTLSGLPTKLSNQDYNIHYVSTSNVASALELGEPIVDELTSLATDGFSAYDCAIDQEVLVMVVVLCYLGDSPMHAEICNCINPGVTLTPCLDENFEHHPLAFRSWDNTQKLTKDIWNLGSSLRTKDEITKARRLHGIRDTVNESLMNQVLQVFESRNPGTSHRLWHDLNSKFGSRVYNPFLRLPGFDGHHDTPVEALHVYLLGVAKYPWQELMTELSPLKPGTSRHSTIIARWASFDTKGLKIPPIIPNTFIQYYKSLVGKEYRVIMQAIPFVLFEEMSREKRHFWSALISLASLIFQNKISNMDHYLIKLRKSVDNFLVCLVGSNARWTNKPKFHMLTHLPKSIQWYGPCHLVATEIFESFNFVLRKASIHSNHLAPGRDIGNSFNSYQMIVHIMLGGTWYDRKLGKRVSAGSAVLKLLSTNKNLQRSLGVNTAWNKNQGLRVKVTQNKTPEIPPDDLPEAISVTRPDVSWERVTCLILPNNQKVEDSTFLWIKPANQTSNELIACVKSMWKPVGEEPSKCMIEMKYCTRGIIHPFYSMREIAKTDDSVFLKPNALNTVLNVQHNCHDGKCVLGSNKFKQVERQDTTIPLHHIIHAENPSYILNSASFYSAETHWRLADIDQLEVTPAVWSQAIDTGVKKWTDEKAKKQKN
ncbi:hypothetical protein DFH28DRAFT_924804 [Melampsora americana]|nr:hypothetical protein DFH28DRAFT_924804 [Melampsora americana]